MAIDESDHIERVSLDTSDTPPIFIGRLIEMNFVRPANRPHRHTFQELIWIQSGTGTHTIDDRSFELHPHTLAVVAQGQVHIFEQAFNVTGYYVRYTDAFLKSSSHDQTPRSITLFNHLEPNGAIRVPPQESADIDVLFGLLAAEYARENSNVKYTILQHLLAVLLLRIDRLRRLQSAATNMETNTAVALYERFLSELERSFMTHHDVLYYAHALHVTPGQLARLLQEMLGKSTKRVILDRLLLEAKRYLQFTDLSIKEIAAQLGYVDPFHFSKVFKQEIGYSPQAYREQLHRN
jgi:AraC family transcriptional regulator, transcriptional activator of pobA